MDENSPVRAFRFKKGIFAVRKYKEKNALEAGNFKKKIKDECDIQL